MTPSSLLHLVDRMFLLFDADFGPFKVIPAEHSCSIITLGKAVKESDTNEEYSDIPVSDISMPVVMHRMQGFRFHVQSCPFNLSYAECWNEPFSLLCSLF